MPRRKTIGNKSIRNRPNKKKNKRSKSRTQHKVHSGVKKVFGVPNKKNLDKYYEDRDVFNPLLKKYLEKKTGNIFTKKHIENIEKGLAMVQDLGKVGAGEGDGPGRLVAASKDSEQMAIRRFSLVSKLIKQEFLGEGAFGSVYHFKDDDGKSFAVKMMLIEDELAFIDEVAINMFFSEEKMGPEVHSVYRLDVCGKGRNGHAFIVMDKLDKTLEEYLEDHIIRFSRNRIIRSY